MAERVSASVSMTSKSFGASRTGSPLPDRRHRVVHRPGEVEIEGVAEFIRLGGLLAIMPGTRPAGAVRAHPILVKLGEEIGERLLSDAADPLRGELEPPLTLVDQPGVGQLLGQLGQSVERVGGIVAEVLSHLVEVHLGE